MALFVRLQEGFHSEDFLKSPRICHDAVLRNVLSLKSTQRCLTHWALKLSSYLIKVLGDVVFTLIVFNSTHPCWIQVAHGDGRKLQVRSVTYADIIHVLRATEIGHLKIIITYFYVVVSFYIYICFPKIIWSHNMYKICTTCTQFVNDSHRIQSAIPMCIATQDTHGNQLEIRFLNWTFKGLLLTLSNTYALNSEQVLPEAKLILSASEPCMIHGQMTSVQHGIY